MAILLLAAIVLSGCTISQTKSSFVSGGTFSGRAEGYKGPISVEIVVNNGAILSVDVTGDDLSYENARLAKVEITQVVVGNQTLEVESVSGATATSDAIVNALKDAVCASGMDVKYFIDEHEEDFDHAAGIEHDYDYVVIGAGAAGLVAAIEGAMQGKRVAIVEKLPFAGGNTALSGGEMSVPESDLQIQYGIHDSTEKMVVDMMNGARGTGNEALIRVLCENINPTVQWMQEQAGIDFQERVYLVKGHSVPRTMIPIGLGAGVVERLLTLAEAEEVQIFYNTKAIDLVVNQEGRVSGIFVNQGTEVFSINAMERVIIATGGFGANVQMRESYNTRWPSLGEEVLTSNSPGSTGDGIRMAQEIGAQVLDMAYIQLFPYNNPASGKHYYLDTIRTNEGAFFVNREGKRFVNEDEVRDIVAGKILEQTAQTSYEVFNQSIIDIIADDPVAMEEVERWLKQGVLIKRDTIEECADYFGINKFALADTLTNYNAYSKRGSDPEFGRLMDFGALDEGPYYMLEGVPSVHYTMGGVAISEDAEVLDKEGNAIPGLYAAGEVTGGIHGENRLGACAVPDALVFGRIAGGYQPLQKSLDN